MSKNKELLFRLTKDDFEIDYFRGSGPGGQHRNTRETAVRIKHPESGAVAEGKERRSREKNQREAFKRLVKSEKFKKWHQRECSRIAKGLPTLEKQVENSMKPENLKIERFDSNEQKWVEE